MQRKRNAAEKKKEEERIVGGYTPKNNKPWAVRLIIFPGVKDFICGGTLINKRYVLTATHCVCKDPMGLTCANGKPTYNIKKSHNVYLGVNHKKIDIDNTGFKDDPQYHYHVESGLTYQPLKKYHDIALLKLDRDVTFKPNVLQSICLPLKSDKSDVVKAKSGAALKVYTSGWGRVFSTCVTDGYGPEKHVKCRYTYSYPE